MKTRMMAWLLLIGKAGRGISVLFFGKYGYHFDSVLPDDCGGRTEKSGSVSLCGALPFGKNPLRAGNCAASCIFVLFGQYGNYQ